MTDRRALALLVLLHLAMVAIVQPRGEFPVNDDWAFAQSVRWLLDEGRLRLSDWAPMYQVPQTLAGAAVAGVFGFSFEALRHVTQGAAVLALFAAFYWFRAAGLDPVSSVIGAAVVAALPMWPVLTNSFMTDVYVLALSLPAATFFLKSLQAPWSRGIVWATAFSIAASLERQVAVAIPFAFMVARLWTRRPMTAREVAIAVTPFLLALAAVIAFGMYLRAGPGVPEVHRAQIDRLLTIPVKALMGDGALRGWIASNVWTMGAYFGLFSIAWLAWWGMGDARRADRRLVWVGGFAILIATFLFDWLPPYRPQMVLDARGIAPMILYDVARAPIGKGEGWFWSLIAIPGCFAAAAVALCAFRVCQHLAFRRSRADPQVIFLSMAIGAYLAPFILTDYFDRYLLFVVPFCAALWTRIWAQDPGGGVRRALAIAWLAFALVLGAAATRDYFSWNRARWDAVHLAERLGGDAESIDAGFEYGGLNRFEKRSPDVPPGKSWYWVKDDRFVVAFSSIAGYEVVETWRVPHWLPASRAEVKLLRRKP